ncbi:MAG TPA: type II secretion system F family protein [Hyphomicrobiales bacterium]|nr:type II secretion system F family protein [Hyphomicrobiales bacterium]
MYFFFACSLLMCCASMVFFAAGLQVRARELLLARRMGASGRLEAGLGAGLLQLFGQNGGRWNLDPEVPVLLDQLGWRRAGQRALFLAAQTGLPVVAALLLALYYLWRPELSVNWLVVLLVMGAALLLPKRLLVAAVARRKRQLAMEVSTMIPLLRMFFEVGMTVEQALRILVNEGERILPQLTRELRVVLARVDGGLELGGELRAMAQVTDVDELKDCIGILEQLLRQGGGAMNSLRNFKALLDERRMLALQEVVSKLSAKMSGVMVAFLFPALLIVLAGPGFIAIFKALGGIAG